MFIGSAVLSKSIHTLLERTSFYSSLLTPTSRSSLHSRLTSAEKRKYSYASFPEKRCLAHLKILGLLGLGISVGYLCRHVPAFKGLEHSISYTIFAMLFIFGITIGANQSLLNNIGEFGIQAAILAICGVLGSLVASFIAYKLFIKKGGLNEK